MPRYLGLVYRVVTLPLMVVLIVVAVVVKTIETAWALTDEALERVNKE